MDVWDFFSLALNKQQMKWKKCTSMQKQKQKLSCPKTCEAQYMCKSTESRMSACCVGKGNGNHKYKNEHNWRAQWQSDRNKLCDLDGDCKD